jgi:two-component system chemotaxis response regulator CheY
MLMMLRLMESLVAKLGFSVVDCTRDGASALTCLRKKTYGLVIADLKMEPITGLQLLRTIRSDPVLFATPVLITTASSDIENARLAKQSGADGFLVKPFTISTLRDKIDAALLRPMRKS